VDGKTIKRLEAHGLTEPEILDLTHANRDSRVGEPADADAGRTGVSGGKRLTP
jgi:hypothetical protein